MTIGTYASFGRTDPVDGDQQLHRQECYYELGDVSHILSLGLKRDGGLDTKYEGKELREYVCDNVSTKLTSYVYLYTSLWREPHGSPLDIKDSCLCYIRVRFGL